VPHIWHDIYICVRGCGWGVGQPRIHKKYHAKYCFVDANDEDKGRPIHIQQPKRTPGVWQEDRLLEEENNIRGSDYVYSYHKSNPYQGSDYVYVFRIEIVKAYICINPYQRSDHVYLFHS